MRTFDGKVAVITGAGSGIGRELALDLAARGAVLALSDKDEVGLLETAERCTTRHAREVHTEKLDVSDRAAVAEYAGSVAGELGRVNAVFNNAGVALHGDFEETPYDQFEWVMNVNFWGVVHGSKEFLPHLIAGGDGHLVNISSLFGLMGMPGQAAYNASKFGVRGFSEALAGEDQRRGGRSHDRRGRAEGQAARRRRRGREAPRRLRPTRRLSLPGHGGEGGGKDRPEA